MWRDTVYSGSLKPISDGTVTVKSLEDIIIRYAYSMPYASKLPTYHDIDCICPGVYLGDGNAARDKRYLAKHGFTHVLNAAEGPDRFQVNTNQSYYLDAKIKYFGIPGHDRPSWNISVYFEASVKFMEEAVNSGGRVLVHCVAGISRSATLVLAYLMVAKGMDVREALVHVLRQRNINPNLGFLQHLIDLNNKLKYRSKFSFYVGKY